MAGGLIQLVAHGIEDMYLSSDPDITFFKVVYRRHTNFSIESVRQNFSKRADFGETVQCTVGRLGDMIGKVIVYVEIPSIPRFSSPHTKFAWVRNLGYTLIKKTEIVIDGHRIDTQYGEWMWIWSQVSGKKSGTDETDRIDVMTGNVPAMYEFTNGKPGYELYIPLEFWFCKETGLALPLVALSQSQVQITVTFREASECYQLSPLYSIDIVEPICPFEQGDQLFQTNATGTFHGFDFLSQSMLYNRSHQPFVAQPITTTSCSIPVSPIATTPRLHLNTRVANRCNQTSRIFNPTPVNFPSTLQTKPILDPQYEILNQKQWKCTPQLGAKETALYPKLDPIHFNQAYLLIDYVYLDTEERAKILKSTHEYLIEQLHLDETVTMSQNLTLKLTNNKPCKAFYWILNANTPASSAAIQLNGTDRVSQRPWEWHTLAEPYYHHTNGPSNPLDPDIGVFSPSINPETHQPSSTINLSKIDNAELIVKLKDHQTHPTALRCYSINYNVLRICFNQGGLAYE